jgi:hypothetical protein
VGRSLTAGARCLAKNAASICRSSHSIRVCSAAALGKVVVSVDNGLAIAQYWTDTVLRRACGVGSLGRYDGGGSSSSGLGVCGCLVSRISIVRFRRLKTRMRLDLLTLVSVSVTVSVVEKLDVTVTR